MPPTLEIKTNSDRLGSFQEGEKNLDNLIEEINILARPQLQNVIIIQIQLSHSIRNYKT